MKEFKGTLGPWHTEDGGYDTLCIGAIIDPVHGHSTTICLMSDYEEAQMLDNANLIAAAPELLDALQKTNEQIKGFNNTNVGDANYRDFVIQYAQNIKIIHKALGDERD